ncbi:MULTISPECIES: cache domain-containing protein [unclassified Thiocapsa]|uniref:PDC sensor domain-containing protein n=1 Tax=unclassified Thiocapsa TaxID=2641286 RepID=UPI0035B2FC81
MAIVYKMSERAESVVYQLSSRIVEEIGEKVVARASGIVRTAEAHLLSNAAVAAGTRVIPGQALFSDLFWQQVVFTPELTGIYIADQAGNFVQARTEPEPSTRVIDRGVTPPTERIIVRDRDYRPLAHLEREPAFDPRERPWYGNTRPERRLQWTDAYRFSGSGRLGITVTYPLLDDEDRILGVLGADATLDSLSAFLSRQDIGPNSAAFLLDDRDRLVAYPHRLEIGVGSDTGSGVGPADIPNTRRFFGFQVAKSPSTDLFPATNHSPLTTDQDTNDLPTTSEIALPWVRNALTSIGAFGASAPSDHAYRSVTDGRTYLTHVISFGEELGLPWRLVIVLDEADLLSEAQRALQESIVVSAIIVMLALFVVYPMAATFAESVEQLTRNTQLLRLFRPGEVVPVKSAFREIREMDQAICSMRDTMVLVESRLPTEVVRALAAGTLATEEPEFIRLCERGFSQYRAGAWDEAIAAFSGALVYAPDDRVCVLLIAHCERLRSEGAAPLDDMNGAPVGPGDPNDPIKTRA